MALIHQKELWQQARWIFLFLLPPSSLPFFGRDSPETRQAIRCCPIPFIQPSRHEVRAAVGGFRGWKLEAGIGAVAIMTLG